MRNLLSIALLILLAACAEFPQLDAAISERARAADYPQIVSTRTLLASVPKNTGTVNTAGIAARANNLRARASRLRGPVVDRNTRARLTEAIARYHQ